MDKDNNRVSFDISRSLTEYVEIYGPTFIFNAETDLSQDDLIEIAKRALRSYGMDGTIVVIQVESPWGDMDKTPIMKFEYAYIDEDGNPKTKWVGEAAAGWPEIHLSVAGLYDLGYSLDEMPLDRLPHGVGSADLYLEELERGQ